MQILAAKRFQCCFWTAHPATTLDTSISRLAVTCCELGLPLSFTLAFLHSCTFHPAHFLLWQSLYSGTFCSAHFLLWHFPSYLFFTLAYTLLWHFLFYLPTLNSGTFYSTHLTFWHPPCSSTLGISPILSTNSTGVTLFSIHNALNMDSPIPQSNLPRQNPPDFTQI